MWFEDKRTNEKSVRAHAEWYIMCYGACTLLYCGELPDTRGMLLCMIGRCDSENFVPGSCNSRSLKTIHARTRVPKIRERAAQGFAEETNVIEY